MNETVNFTFQAFLSMQHPASQPVINPATIDNALLEEYIAPRFLRKMKSKVKNSPFCKQVTH